MFLLRTRIDPIDPLYLTLPKVDAGSHTHVVAIGDKIDAYVHGLGLEHPKVTCAAGEHSVQKFFATI